MEISHLLETSTIVWTQTYETGGRRIKRAGGVPVGQGGKGPDVTRGKRGRGSSQCKEGRRGERGGRGEGGGTAARGGRGEARRTLYRTHPATPWCVYGLGPLLATVCAQLSVSRTTAGSAEPPRGHVRLLHADTGEEALPDRHLLPAQPGDGHQFLRRPVHLRCGRGRGPRCRPLPRPSLCG